VNEAGFIICSKGRSEMIGVRVERGLKVWGEEVTDRKGESHASRLSPGRVLAEGHSELFRADSLVERSLSWSRVHATTAEQAKRRQR
jgi:hypothetical protein